MNIVLDNGSGQLSTPLTAEQFDIIERYLVACINNKRKPQDSTIITMLIDAGVPAHFPVNKTSGAKKSTRLGFNL